MQIEGCAYSKNGLWQARRDRWLKIRYMDKQLTIKRNSSPGVVNFHGTLDTEQALDLTEEDIALIVDGESMVPFGGGCKKVGNEFSGYINTR